MQSNGLGKLCQHRRVARLITLEELAIAAGITEAELEQIETGEAVPQNSAVERINRALSDAASWLSNQGEHNLLSPVLAPPPAAEPECDKSHLQPPYVTIGLT